MRGFFWAVLALALALLVSPLGAQQTRVGSSVDPNAFNLVASGPDINQNTKVFTLRAQQLPDPTIRNLLMVVLGQSNQTNVLPSIYVPNNPLKLDQMSLTDGGIYSAADPMLSLTGTGGMPALIIGDSFITANLFDRVVILPAAAGGTSAADWDTGIESSKIPAVISRLKSKGWVNGTNVTVVFLWWQGEQDTTLGTSQVSYTASLNSIIAKSRTAGFNGLWFVNVETLSGGVISTNVQNAQIAVVNHGAGVWQGANLDSLVGNVCSGVNCRQADNLHLSDAGAASADPLQRAAMHASGAPF